MIQEPTYLIDDMTAFEPNGYVCFWKPGDTDGIFSNWAATPFENNGDRYPTSEHYMMAAKARLMGDEKTRQQILVATNPAVVKKLGQQVKPWNERMWIDNRCRIMYEACMAKFSSSAALKAKLLATGDKVLVEASPLDKIWGVGLIGSDPKSKNPREWKGLNLLGKVLMKVREDLRA